MSKARWTVKLRGVEVELEGTICPSEPDVGIMSAYAEDWEVIDPPEAKDWTLTDEEAESIQEAASDWYYDWSDDDSWEEEE